MKRLPRVPVWLVLLPLVALAVTSLFGSATAQSFATSRQAYAAPQPAASNPAARPTPGPQPTHACPPPRQGPRGGREWHDEAWGGGLWFDLANLENNPAPSCGPRGHGPPPWHHGHHWRFHLFTHQP
jgi:hypothetical protein